MDLATTADRLATAAGDVARLQATGPEPRTSALVGGLVPVVDLGVQTPWSVQALVPAGAVPREAIAEAVAWCRERGGARGFRVNVSPARAPLLAGSGLVVRDRMGVYARPAPPPTDTPADSGAGTAAGSAPRLTRPAELEIGAPRSRDELVAAYGGWMSDLPLAEALVGVADLASPDTRFLVGTVAGRPVGCAFVWFAAGTACLSGIGIVPDARRRGYGRALTAAAVAVAAEGGALHPRPDLVWMHATSEGAALYSTMGFHHVDTHLLLGPADTAAGLAGRATIQDDVDMFPPGLITMIDHVGIAVPDLDEAITFYQESFGFRLVHQEVNADQGIREAMLAVGDSDTRLQLLAPLSPTSGIAAFLERKGPGVQQVAYRVTSMEDAMRAVRAQGMRLLYDEPRRGTSDSRINFIHPKDAGGVLVELVQPADPAVPPDPAEKAEDG